MHGAVSLVGGKLVLGAGHITHTESFLTSEEMEVSLSQIILLTFWTKLIKATNNFITLTFNISQVETLIYQQKCACKKPTFLYNVCFGWIL